MKLSKKVVTHSKQFKEIAAKHIMDMKDPQDYGLHPTDARGLVEALAKEVSVNPNTLGSFGELAEKQVNGGSFLVPYYEIMDMMTEDLGYDPQQLNAKFEQAGGQDFIWKFYIQFIAKGLAELYKMKHYAL